MLYKKINLNKYYRLNTKAWIEIFVPINNDDIHHKKTKVMIVVPGGGYSMVSNREADPVSISYLNEGFATVILHYTVQKPYPTQVLELACTIDYLRNNSNKLYIDENKIALVGFSAGGHLVASYGYLYKRINYLDVDSEQIKPNCLVCSYPVITMKEFTHLDTKKNITNNDQTLIDLLSVEEHIDSTYPKTFVWTTKEDTAVPYQNTEMFIEALKQANVECDYFIYPYLNHGLSVVNKLLYDDETLNDIRYKEVSEWFKKSVDFVNKVFNELK